MAAMLSLGKRCSAAHCNTIDFLPTACPECGQSWCGTHLHSEQHRCFQATETASMKDTRFAPSARCHLGGCEQVTIEAAGLTKTREDVEVIGKAVRCSGCGEAFCFAHRNAEAHHCPVPSPEEAYAQAKVDRKRAAEAAIKAVMPGRGPTVRRAPPAGREVGGLNLEQKLGRHLSTPQIVGEAPVAEPAAPRAVGSLPKGKEDKLKAIALMKLKGKAVPSSASVNKLPITERWCLTWAWDESGASLKQGSAIPATQAVWVGKNSAGGRVIDDLAALKSIANSPTTEPDQRLSLILIRKGDSPLRLELSATISSATQQGDVVVLVRGKHA